MKRFCKEEKEKFVKMWMASGKSKWAFAQEQGLIPQTFSRWAARNNETFNFVEVKTKLNPPEVTNYQEIVIERGEIKIRIPCGINQQGIEVVKTLWEILA